MQAQRVIFCGLVSGLPRLFHVCQVDKSVLMVFLGVGQFDEKFAEFGRRDGVGGLSIKAARLRLHSHGRPEHTPRLQYAVEPYGSPLNEPFYILSTHKRDMVAIRLFERRQ